jgi:glucose-6-phosphate dehydrogenase assembly protein OpcA
LPTRVDQTGRGSAPRGVDPDALIAELRAQWHHTGAPERVSRAALLNLVVRATRGDETVAARTVAHVAASIPCRAILLVESDSESLEAWASSHCQVSASGRQVSCQQITLAAPPQAADAVVATLLAVTIADLPIVVWWDGDDPRAPFLDRLAHRADRVVFDSAAFAPAELAAAAALSARSGSPVVDDVAWARLNGWRELTAALFDAAPFDRLLGTVHAVEIVHTKGGDAPAWLFAGWLASRLGWRPERRRGGTFHLASAGGAVELRMRAESSAQRPAPAGLQRVCLRAADSTQFVVEPDGRHAELLAARVERDAACPLPQHRPCRGIDVDEELLRVLSRPRPNVAFTQALAVAATLCEMRA